MGLEKNSSTNTSCNSAANFATIRILVVAIVIYHIGMIKGMRLPEVKEEP
jgi:hypothetical protein